MRFRELKKLIERLTTPGVSLAQVQAAISSGLIVLPDTPGSLVGSYDWVSNGDENGIFFALGALDGSWSNPADGGVVVPSESSYLVPWNPPPTAVYLTDRNSAVNIFHSAGVGDSWVQWDFGTAHAVSLREYTVRNRWDSGLYWPTHWKLQGSNNGTDWTDIDEEAAPGYTAVDQWKHFTVDTPDAGPYRYIRLHDTTDAYLTLSEVELYGDLVTV